MSDIERIIETAVDVADELRRCAADAENCAGCRHKEHGCYCANRLMEAAAKALDDATGALGARCK